MVQPIGEAGFNVGKGKITCCDVLNRPEHWRDDEADKIWDRMEIQKDSLLYSGRSEYDYIDSYENVIADSLNSKSGLHICYSMKRWSSFLF